jgi:hypothetical protein
VPHVVISVHLAKIIFLLIGQGQQTLASHSLKKFTNSTPAYLIIDQSYADGISQTPAASHYPISGPIPSRSKNEYFFYYFLKISLSIYHA